MNDKSAFDIKKGDLVVCTNDGREIIGPYGRPVNVGLTTGNVYKVISVDSDIITIRNDNNLLSRHSILRFIKINDKIKIK